MHRHVSDSVTERDLLTDTAWLSKFYRHPNEDLLIPFTRAVLSNPFYTVASQQRFWEDAIVAVNACNWLKASRLPPGFEILRNQKPAHASSMFWLRIKYLGDFLNRNKMYGDEPDSDEDFPQFWNLDYSPQRRAHFMRGLFYYTGKHEPLTKMLMTYGDWLVASRDLNEHHVKEDDTGVLDDLNFALRHLITNDEIAASHLKSIAKIPGEVLPLEDEVRERLVNSLALFGPS